MNDQFGFLDFKVISQTPFSQVLKALEVHFTEKDGKLIGDDFIVTIEKNLYVEKGRGKGDSVIGFVSSYKHCSLRAAAFWIKESCMTAPAKEEHKIPVLNLVYHPCLESVAPAEICTALNVGYCKEKSIMSGHICFKVGDHYIGYHPERKTWLSPKSFSYDTLFNLQNCTGDIIIVVNPFDALYLASLGINAAATMRIAITDQQAELIKGFKRALIFHDEPQNLVEKLAGHLFIRTHPRIERPTKEQVLELL